MTQDEVMQMMTDMGLHEGGMDNWVADNAWWKFAKLVAQHEREACAKVCEQTNDGTPYNLAEACAEAIRARGDSK
jgi:hypothetical protein